MTQITRTIAIALSLVAFSASQLNAAYPVVRPERQSPAPSQGDYRIYPDQDQQVVWGMGFEIQSDSIASGNAGLPEARTSVPHDLTPAERKRLADEMLTGFRYCRLAGGLYWRGTDPEGKFMQPRWPEQLQELKELLDDGGVEGLSLEYWSPAPYWKSNRGYTRAAGNPNTLRCFGPDFDKDPDYHGDVDRFLKDFAHALVTDIETLEDAGLRVSKWGLQNEPWVNQSYSSCQYTIESYGRTFKAVAPSIRAHDPSIMILADTNWGVPKYIAPVMNTEYAKYVDALVVHAIGDDSKRVPNNFKQTRQLIRQELPLFQNEYEYLQGPASRDRCHNTVQNIMNWYQLAESPTWYWIHILKPFKNAEASGYSLGFWMPIDDNYAQTHGTKEINVKAQRATDKYTISNIPEHLIGTYAVTINRGNGMKPAPGYTFTVTNKSEVFLLVHNRGTPKLPAGWEKTDTTIAWSEGQTDTVYRKVFEAGTVTIPGHNGKLDNGYHGIPHAALVNDISGKTTVVQIDNLPKTGRVAEIKKADADKQFADLKPGHWTWNKYNWHSVVGFLKHMPWDSTVVKIDEKRFDHDMRILAYRKPDGKLVVVLANRSWGDYTFNLNTGLENDAEFKGYRYTPDNPGEDFMGVPIGTLTGTHIAPTVPDLSWEFWVQQ